MRKMKIITMSVAVVLAVGAAMATKPKVACGDLPLFYKSGNNYLPVPGSEGIAYVCSSDPHSICTYYYDEASGQYRACKAGRILFVVR